MYLSETNSAPRVSFLLAAFNEEKYIADAVFSCLNQTCAEVEVIVTDDGSVDGTTRVLQTIQEQDARLNFFSFPKNRGKVAAFNHCFRKSTGSFISLLGADDLAPADRIARSLPPLQDHRAELVCGDCIKFSAQGRITDSAMYADHGIDSDCFFDFDSLLKQPKVFGGTITFTRSLGEVIFPLDENLQHEDWWLPLAAAARRPVQYLHRPFCYYRIHGHNEKETNLTQAEFDSWRGKSQLRKVIHYQKVLAGFSLTPAQQEYVKQKKMIHQLMLAPNAAKRLRRGWAAAPVVFGRELNCRDRLKFFSAWLFPRLAFEISKRLFIRSLRKTSLAATAGPLQ